LCRLLIFNQDGVFVADQIPMPEATNIKCPVCKEAVIGPAQGRYGLYWKCTSETKKCRFNLPAKPTGRYCHFRRGATPDAVCGAMMVEGTKTIPERCSDKACPNRNPHKLAKA
jgi:hypothetical protein